MKDLNDAHRAGVKIRELADQAEVWTPPTSKPKADWRDKLTTAADLRNKEFPPVSCVVPGILPEGTTILSGKPKVGKSFMALDFSLGVSDSVMVLGALTPMTGDVLYAANEDTYRRLQNRISKMLGPHTSWPERLSLATEWARLDIGGVTDLQEWANSVQQPRLAIIDTLATVRPPKRGNETPYDADYRALAELHDVVSKVPGLAALVLQHNRKAESEDPIDLISGTLGGPGVADTLLILNRTSQGITLHIRGRDLEERDLAVHFNKQTCRWSLMGDASDVHLSETRKKISTALAKVEKMTPKEIAFATGLDVNVVYQRLPSMSEEGQVVRLTRGTYAHPLRAPTPPI